MKLNPMIPTDDIPQILQNLDAEEVTGVPSMEELQQEIDTQEAETEV